MNELAYEPHHDHKDSEVQEKTSQTGVLEAAILEEKGY